MESWKCVWYGGNFKPLITFFVFFLSYDYLVIYNIFCIQFIVFVYAGKELPLQWLLWSKILILNFGISLTNLINLFSYMLEVNNTKFTITFDTI
jgi:hypothetical protein